MGQAVLRWINCSAGYYSGANKIQANKQLGTHTGVRLPGLVIYSGLLPDRLEWGLKILFQNSNSGLAHQSI